MAIMSLEQLREHLLDSEATLRRVEWALRDLDNTPNTARPAWFLFQARRCDKDAR